MPIRPAGVQLGPNPVVLEIAEPESDSLDAFLAPITLMHRFEVTSQRARAVSRVDRRA